MLFNSFDFIFVFMSRDAGGVRRRRAAALFWLGGAGAASRVVCFLRLWGPLCGFVAGRIDGIQLRRRPGHSRGRPTRGGKAWPSAPRHLWQPTLLGYLENAPAS